MVLVDVPNVVRSMDEVIRVRQHNLKFKRPAGTSRGILTEKPSWILLYQGEKEEYWSECPVIPGLSPDFISEEAYLENLNQALVQFQDLLKKENELSFPAVLTSNWENFPSILFGLEIMWRKIQLQSNLIYDNPASRGQQKIPINGLIWMGDLDFMVQQLEDKLTLGFTTIKFKIGALDWEKELGLLSGLRKRFDANTIEIRVDANGAFSSENVVDILQSLKELEVHSIEQPIRAGNPTLMHELQQLNLVPIALDEELIGVNSVEEKRSLLHTIRPKYIVLKPSLHGGFHGTTEWISLAESMGIGWWITSALESSIGLDAIAQFTGNFQNLLPQGLGTGSLYENNFPANWIVEKGFIQRVV